jgi:hypothetical protein
MKIKMIGMMLVITIVGLTGCSINIPIKTSTSETQDNNRNHTSPHDIPNENSNQNSSNSNQDSTPTNKPDEELEPHIKVGEVDSTEMDAAYVTTAQLIDIPQSMKVDGTWSFHAGSIKSSSVNCDPDQHYCEAYFPINQFSEGETYTLTVEFEGQIDGSEAYLKETKSFVAPKPYNN